MTFHFLPTLIFFSSLTLTYINNPKVLVVNESHYVSVTSSIYLQ